MTNQRNTGDNIEDIQFYDNEKYDNICDTIIYYYKILIQNYQNKLNMIPNDLDKQIDNKIIELQRISQSKNRKLRNLIEKLLEIF